MDKIFIYQRVIPHYRVAFFDGLYEKLLGIGVRLVVISGQERQGTVPKSVFIDRPWLVYKKNIYVRFFGKEIVIQGLLLDSLRPHSPIILEHANRLLINYLFLTLRFFGFIKLGLWGHGKNFQKNEAGLQKRIKELSSLLVDVWFCYTKESKALVEDLGFPSEFAFNVNNTIDTSLLLSESKRWTENECKTTLALNGFAGGFVAIYCGGMYQEKCIDLLLQSCDLVKEKVSSFEVVFIGDGPDSNKVEDFVSSRAWAIYTGSLTGRERVKYFKLADVMLIPGLVGLAVIDSFVFQTPLVTTDYHGHSPEFSYIVPDVNGVVTKHQAAEYASGIVRLSRDRACLNSLKQGCLESSSLYTIENMVENFFNGVVRLIGSSEDSPR